jgi:ubiquinone/menaquinone biosynthesis C-methylase UbiE
MTEHRHHFLPAMGHPALTPFYDSFTRLIAREETFKRRLTERLALRPGMRVLDVGCGTGTLAIQMAQTGATVSAIDADDAILARARHKAQAAKLAISFRRALATELPFDDGSFDRVTSTLMAHHLPTAEKQQMFAEIRRVLTPSGELHLVDVGPARSSLGRSLQRLLRPRVLIDNLDGKLPLLMAAGGLADVVEEDRVVTVLGPLVFWRAVPPPPDRGPGVESAT